MTTAIVGPSQSGGGTPFGQLIPFPSHYPNYFTLNGETFLRTGAQVRDLEIAPELSQFKKFNRRHQLTNPPTQSRLLSAVSLAPTGKTILIGRVGVIDRSVDHGKTWQAVAVAGGIHLTGFCGNGLGTWLANQTGTNKLFRSTDNGDSWTEISNVLVGNTDKTRAAYLGNQTWVIPNANSNGLLRSTNDGVAWSAVSVPQLTTIRYIATDGQGTAIMQGQHTSGVSAYWRTANFGSSWGAARFLNGTAVAGASSQVIEQNTDVVGQVGNIAFGHNQLVFAWRRARQPETTVEAYFRKLMVSTDGGVTFTENALSGLCTFGSWESVHHLGDGLFLTFVQNNESNGSARGDISCVIYDLSPEILDLNTPLVGSGLNIFQSSGLLISGSAGNVNHDTISLYDSVTGEFFIAINGSGLLPFTSDEVVGVHQSLAVYSGGIQGGAMYYYRVK